MPLLRILFLLFTISISLSAGILPQGSQRLQFQYLSLPHEFNESTILKLHQDGQGFIWMACLNGIYRYDGWEIKEMGGDCFMDNIKKVVITENENDHALWLLLNDSIFQLNLENGQCRSFPTGLENINVIHRDNGHFLWIGTRQKGIHRIDTESGEVAPWKCDEHLNKNAIRDIKHDEAGNLFFLTAQRGVYKYNSKTDQMVHFKGTTDVSNVLHVDQNENFWIGTFNGLWRWDKTKRKYLQVRQIPKPGTEDCKITEMAESKPGILYVATSRGLYIHNTLTGATTHHQGHYDQKGTIGNNYINSILFDKENTLWIATFFGGIYHLSESFQNVDNYEDANHSMAGNVVSCFAEDNDHRMWISTKDGGLACWDRSSQQMTNIDADLLENKKPLYHKIQTLLFDDGHLFLGMSNKGVYHYDLKKNKAENLLSRRENRKLSSHTILSFLKHDSQLLIGSKKGLDVYDFTTQTLHKIKEVPNKNVQALLYDSEFGLWCCGNGLGIYHKPLLGKWHKADHPSLTTDKVSTMAQVRQTIYFGTLGEGIFTYDMESGAFQHLDIAPIQQDNITNLLVENGRLWICTHRNLFRYTPQTNHLQHFDFNKDKRANSFSPNSGIVTHDGDVLLGTTNGFIGFRPQHIQTNKIPPRTTFTEIAINNKVVTPATTHSPLKKLLPYTKEITLSHSQNNISIKYASLSYLGGPTQRFRYKLYPNQNDWTYTSSNTINIPELAAGKYSLTVCGCNNDFIWDKEGCTLNITILRPFWLSRWMLSTYLLLIAAASIYAIFYIQKRQKQRIEDFKHKKEKELYQSKIEFFTNIIHDFRTPLTLIVSPLQAIRQRKEAAPFQFELDLIQRNSERLLKQANQLMDFQKSERGDHTPTQMKPVKIVDELKPIMTDFDFETRNKGIALLFEKEDGTEQLTILGYSEGIDKIFFNLLSNALKFAKSEIKISVSKDEDHCYIKIADDGIGIPESMRSKIFEPFVQIKEQLPKDYIGTGIGLFIVKNIVDEMNGHISINSDEGKGTEFILSFPLLHDAKETSAQAESKGNGQPDGEEEIPANKGKDTWSVAVVEDNNDMRNFVSSILEGQYSVHSYSNGEELLKDITTIQFDLIVSDVMMPGKDGYTLCKEIKENTQTKHIPVILLTAKIQETDEIAGLDAGADAYIRKPFSVELLRSRIKNLIENRERLFKEFKHNPQKQLTDIVEDENGKEFVEKLNRVVYENLKNPQLNAQYVASELCICRTLFFSKIKAYTGMTFVDYVQIARLKRAVELLTTQEHTVTEVAEETGYASVSYFYRLFKKQYGKTPTEFLKEYK